ncbi:hypothetical protein KCV00_g408, partial [Aureobasidium melanogenum]
MDIVFFRKLLLGHKRHDANPLQDPVPISVNTAPNAFVLNLLLLQLFNELTGLVHLNSMIVVIIVLIITIDVFVMLVFPCRSVGSSFRYLEQDYGGVLGGWRNSHSRRLRGRKSLQLEWPYRRVSPHHHGHEGSSGE